MTDQFKKQAEGDSGQALTVKQPICGRSILANRSRFLACAAPAHPGADPAGLLAGLVKSFRLSKASHLSWALRLGDGTEQKHDGGESGSGNCIMEVLRALRAEDCLVLVARWYGGRHLGGLRFRIYAEASRELLQNQAERIVQLR